jgi:choline dehydrogenase-like flavoprotein
MEVIRGAEEWDAIVVGSGANGGVAAWKLTRAGFRVLVLEAGTPVTRRRDHGSFVTNGVKQLYRHLVSHRQEVQKSHPTYWATNPDFFVDDVDNPYSTPPDKPFRWIRSRRVGPLAGVGRGHSPLLGLRFQGGEPGRLRAGLAHLPRRPAPHYAELERLLGCTARTRGSAAAGR